MWTKIKRKHTVLADIPRDRSNCGPTEGTEDMPWDQISRHQAKPPSPTSANKLAKISERKSRGAKMHFKRSEEKKQA
jgi:hypothetical protein